MQLPTQMGLKAEIDKSNVTESEVHVMYQEQVMYTCKL